MRWKQRFTSFDKVLIQLDDACVKSSYSDLERAGLIKTFELCFELFWKVLKDLLLYEGYEEKGPRSVIRRSFEVGYIDEQDCEILLEALEKRNVLSHTYSENVSIEVEALIKSHYYPVLSRLRTVLRARAS